MRIAIISGGDGWHVRDLQRAAVAQQHVAEAVDFRRLFTSVAAGAEALAGFDAVIVRTMPPGSLEQVVFRMDLLHRLQARGVTVLNSPRALETCVDKYLATALLEAAGLRVPPTIVCQHADAALEAFAALGGDVVVKPLFGSEGRGMMRISDPELGWRTFRTLEQTRSIIYLQQFVRHPGWDLRVFVLAGEVLAAMRRVSRGDWRTNVAQGGSGEKVTLNAAQRSLALRAAAALGAVAAGVDLLPGPDGEWYVIEVNAVPGWRALAPATGVDIAAALVQFAAGPASRGEAMYDAGLCTQLACIWEATARKAGNVHRYRDFDDTAYTDFLLSAAAIAPLLTTACQRSVGETVRDCVRVTRSVVRTNTNLGIVLLLAPLAAVPADAPLRDGVSHILAALTVNDAEHVYEAIRLASPGGLGRVEEQDVHAAPTQTLREVMALAADRDLIARQYANDFADMWTDGVPAIVEGLRQTRSLEGAVLFAQLTLLAKHPDTLIARKRGVVEAREASQRAAGVLAADWPQRETGWTAFADFDAWLRAEGRQRNPGATADLLTACLFILLREGTIRLPLEYPWPAGFPS